MSRINSLLDLFERKRPPGRAAGSQEPQGPDEPDGPGYDEELEPHKRPVLTELLPAQSVQLRLVDLLPESMVTTTADRVGGSELTLVEDVDLVAPYVTLRATAAGDALTLGVAADDGTRLVGVLGGGGARIEACSPGGDPTVLAERGLEGDLAGRTFAATVTENVLALWEWTGRWQQLIFTPPTDHPVLDLRPTGVVDRLRFAHAGEATDLAGGWFGYLGLRDPHPVEYSLDGRTLSVEGRALVTMTCAGPSSFRTAHWGLFSVSAGDPTDLRLESNLFTERDGMVLGDHGGQIVRSPQWRYEVAVSGWGDFVDVGRVHRTQLGDLPRGRAVRLPVTPMPLPTGFSAWDPAMTWVDGSWYVAFVECWEQRPRFRFRPVLVRTASLEEEGERVGSDELHEQTEGMMFIRSGDHVHLLASDGDSRDFPVYDLGMHRIGTWPAPYDSGIPHQALVRWAGNRVWFSSDDSPYDPDLPWGSHGDLVLHPVARD